MKPVAQAWEAEDGTLHRTAEEAEQHEHVRRIDKALNDWATHEGGARWGIQAHTHAIRLIAKHLYSAGARMPGSEPTAVSLHEQWRRPDQTQVAAQAEPGAEAITRRPPES